MRHVCQRIWIYRRVGYVGHGRTGPSLLLLRRGLCVDVAVIDILCQSDQQTW